MLDNGTKFEVLEFAISREVESSNFYQAIAKRVDDIEIQKVLEDLALEELDHKSMLELEVIKMGRTIDETPKPLSPDRKYIISDDDSPFDMDYKDILLLSIEKEDASFRTYINLLTNLPQNDESRDVLLAIAQEEVKHKLRFEMEYDILMKKS